MSVLSVWIGLVAWTTLITCIVCFPFLSSPRHGCSGVGQGDELDPVSELQQQVVQRDIELADQKYQRVQLQAELRRLKEESSYADVFALYVLAGFFFVSSATTAEYVS